MLHKVFKLSHGKVSLDQKSEESIHLNSSNDNLSKDDLTRENIARNEKAEQLIWQGIQAEKQENFNRAISYYRLAIKEDSESATAYQLLSKAVRRLREQRHQELTKVCEQKKTESSAKIGIDPSARVDASANKNQSKYFTISNLETNSSPCTQMNSQQSTRSSFSNVELTPTSTALDTNTLGVSKQQSSKIVILPEVSISHSGDTILPDNVAASQVYVEQALEYFGQKQWDNSISACQEALKICPITSEAYKIWGNCLQKSGNIAGAIGIYAKALEIQPDMAEIYCNLGSIYANKKNWQKAIEHYQKSSLIDPNNATPFRNLARVWDELKEYEKSAACFFKAIELDPSLLPAQSHFELAKNLFEEERLEQAISCYKLCIQIEPKFFNAYIGLADALEKDGQTEAALFFYKKLAQLQAAEKNQEKQSKSRQQIRSFLNPKSSKSARLALKASQPKVNRLNPDNVTKSFPQLQPAKVASLKEQIAQALQAVKQQPKSGAILANLGNLYFQARQWQKATDCYCQAIKYAPDQAEYYINLGKALEKNNDRVRSSQAFYRGFSLQPDQIAAENHYVLGNKLLDQGQREQAISCYRRALNLKPDLVEALWKLGKILESQNNHQAVLTCYKQAIKMKPDQAQSYLLLGQELARTEQWQSALKCYQKAVDLEPKNADIQHNLGEILSKEQQWQAAANAYRKSIAIDSGNFWSHNNLGNALLKMQQWQAAAECFRQANKLRVDFVWSHYNLGEALFELKEFEPALEAYKAAENLDPNLPEIQGKIGAVLHQRSQASRQEALSFYQAQITQETDNVELYHQAIALDAKNYELYLGLGKALFKQGKVDEAIAIYQLGLKLQPKHSELMQRLNEAMLAKSPESELGALISKVKAQTLNRIEGQFNDESSAREIDSYNLQIPKHPSPLVSIIIPVYNQIDYTFNCLRSIVQNVGLDLPLEVIVVNDCSSDNTVKVLERIEGLNRIDNPHNMGFLNSCNRGISEAKGEYIYLLNNDTELNPQALEHLVEVLEQDPQVGAVGSKLNYPHGNLQEAGGIIWQDGSGWNYGREENSFAPQYNYMRPVDYCSAASLLVRKSVMHALKGFDSNFAPAYYEDTDLCMAIRHRLNLKVMYQPKSEVIHHEGVSCGTELSSGIKRYQSLNMTKFQQKWSQELQQYPVNTGKEGVNAASRRHLGAQTILVLDIYPPCYDKESGARRIWELIQIFKQLNYRVIFMPDNGAKEQPYVGMLQDLGVEVIYTQDGYGTSIEEQLCDLLPLIDIAWVSRPQLYEKYAPLIRQQDGVKLIYDTVDLHYLRLQRAGKLADNNIENMREWIRMQSRELRAAHEADLTITITNAEKEILQQQQVDNLAVVPNIHQIYLGEKPSFEQRQDLLFIGSYNHPPNIDGAIWLCQEIMPLVWQQIPDMKVTLLGSNTTREIIKLAKDERITVTGYVADVAPYFLSHRLFVAPLRYGAGMKGKIGQSLEYGLPIVSTKIGTEGMNLQPETDVLEADETVNFARQIVRLYQDQDMWNKLSSNSNKAIASFTRTAIKQEVLQVLNRLMN